MATTPAANVIIDFSNACTPPAVASYVERTGAALVSGTTGYTAEQLEQVKQLGKHARVMWSGNYSIGVAALRHLVAQATRELPGFDVEICETHHNQKVDAPSGTAKMLLDEVIAAEPESDYYAQYGREGMCGKRDSKEIGMHSLRGGTVAGVHTVSFFGTDEEVSSPTVPRAAKSSLTAHLPPRRNSQNANPVSTPLTKLCSSSRTLTRTIRRLRPSF